MFKEMRKLISQRNKLHKDIEKQDDKLESMNMKLDNIINKIDELEYQEMERRNPRPKRGYIKVQKTKDGFIGRLFVRGKFTSAFTNYLTQSKDKSIELCKKCAEDNNIVV